MQCFDKKLTTAFNFKDIFQGLSKNISPSTGNLLPLKVFEYFLGGEFTIYADLKPVIDALLSEAARGKARVARQLTYVSKYNTYVQHLCVASNTVDDALTSSKIFSSFYFVRITLTKAQLVDQKLLSFI